jgi:dTMP kinase
MINKPPILVPGPIRRGKFIVIEGIDGAGKTELVKSLAQDLDFEGYDVVTTHEPSSILEPYIRNLFKRPQGPPPPDEMTVLFTADRLIHMAETIRPALERGSIVICDRHKLSTMVYQTANGASPSLVEAMVYLPQPEPDLTLILDLDPELARDRMAARNGLDSYERDLEKQKRMRSMYLANRNRFGPSAVLFADQDPAIVQGAALLIVRECIQKD